MSLLGLCLLLGFSAGQTEFPEPVTVWECSLQSPLAGAPVFFPSTENPEGVLTWLEDGRLVLIDGAGTIRWEKPIGEKGDASPAVGDLNKDGTPEIVTATASGILLVMTAEGKELWRYPLGGDVRDWEAPCLADVDGDGLLEIIIGNMRGWLSCISGTGKLLWRFKADDQKASSPAYIPSSLANGGLIIYGTENDHIVAVRSNGELAWLSRHEGQYGRSTPVAGDLDGDGTYEVVAHTSYNNPRSRVLALDAMTGNLVWEAPINLHGYAGNAIADLDGDGKNEVLVALRSNTIYCFDHTGKEKWHTITGGQAYFYSPAIADIDGDGKCEIIGGVRDTNERGNSWFVLSDRGELLREYPIPGGSPATPLIGDINKDGVLEIVLAGTKAGLLRCVSFGGKSQNARLLWVSPRFDAARTGCVISNAVPRTLQAPTKPGRRESLNVEWAAPPTWGRNALSIKAWPKETKDLVIEYSTVDPLGRKTTRVVDTHGGKLPASLAVDLVGRGTHLVRVRAYRFGEYTSCLAEVVEKVKLGSFQTFAEKMQQDLESLERSASALPAEASHMARLLMERKAQRVNALAVLERMAAKTDWNDQEKVDELFREIESFRTAVRMDLTLNRHVRKMAETDPKAVLAVWEDKNPWDDSPVLSEEASPARKTHVSVWLYKNEYESAAVNLLNLTAEPLVVQLRVSPAVRHALLLYEVIDAPRSDGSTVPDALAELNSAATITIPGGGARRLWTTVNGKRLEPGSTELPITLLPLGKDTERAEVVLEANVESLDLATAPIFRVCNWSSPNMLKVAGVDPSQIAVAREHGMNVFVTSAPERQCDTRGNLVGAVDWSVLDEQLPLMGDDGFLLLSLNPVSVPQGVESFSDIHITAERARLQELAQHLKEKGWGPERWALYPVDEPGLFGGTRIRLYEQLAGHFKRAMPNVLMYANPSGFVTPENMAGMVPLTDIWQPEQGLLRRQPELASFFLNTGKPVWCYEAPGDVKGLRPLGYYRANPWMAFRLGLSGTGFWTQFYKGTNEKDCDLWLSWANSEYGANYIANDKEIISRRWEAFRDGIEDVRAFLLLRKTAQDPRAVQRHPDLVRQAEDLLRTDVDKATQRAWECGDITRFLRDYEMDYSEICRIRREVARLTQQLKAE